MELNSLWISFRTNHRLTQNEMETPVLKTVFRFKDDLSADGI